MMIPVKRIQLSSVLVSSEVMSDTESVTPVDEDSSVEESSVGTNESSVIQIEN